MIERNSTGLDRVQIGMNPLHLSWTIAPGSTFNSPEAVAVYSDRGLGGMSRSFHRLYRDHLSRSSWTHKDRPVVINHWEATEFEYDDDKIFRIAKAGNDLGCKLVSPLRYGDGADIQAVLDDGWFGKKYPRNGDSAGLGDWQVNEDKLKGGLNSLVQRITSSTTTSGEPLKFGLWVEPEHCNPTSEVFEQHPEWTLHAKANGQVYTRIQQRFQHVLNLALVEVQDHLIKVIGEVIASTGISYVKWDSNKAMDQMADPSTAHAYILGLYRVLGNLTQRFPDILWEGCASGGGRFDPGLLYYFPGSWTSDNTDPADRLFIQSGISLVYPPSSMSGHIASIPSQHSHRNTPLEFRAHVAMLCGSFGLELDPGSLSNDEKDKVKQWILLSERISPFIVQGDLYRLATPDKSNWPAFLYMTQDGSEAVLLAYQLLNKVNNSVPSIRLQGLDARAEYVIDSGESYSGDTLMNVGLKLPWKGDHDSRIMFITRA